MKLQATPLRFKVRIKACRRRGHSGMCVAEKGDVGVESQGTPCTGQHWQQDACCSRGRKRARNRTVTRKVAASESLKTQIPSSSLHSYVRITDTGSIKNKRCDCHNNQVHLSVIWSKSTHDHASSLLADHPIRPNDHASPHITRLWYVFRGSRSSFTTSSTSFPLAGVAAGSDEVDRAILEDSASEWSSCAVAACRRRIMRN